jgi:hypothetical protein
VKFNRFTEICLKKMLTLLLFILLFIISWPLAILALILYPLFWLILLPFRILGFAVDGILDLIKQLFLLPGRILRRI